MLAELKLVDVLTIAALITGPIVAVLITLWHQSRTQKRAAKERLFMTLMAHRRSIPPTIDWANSLNLIDMIYTDNPRVTGKWHELYSILERPPVNWGHWNHVYIEMLSEMARAMGYKRLTQVQIDQFYAPQAHGDQAALQGEIQKEFLRVLKATQTIEAILPPRAG